MQDGLGSLVQTGGHMARKQRGFVVSKYLFMLWFLASSASCSYLMIVKDCAKVESNDSIGDNKFVCRQIKPWE